MKIIPKRNLYGSIESYSVYEDDALTSWANGTVATWLLRLPFMLFLLAISPIMYFVTLHMLRKERKKTHRNKRRWVKLIIANIIFLCWGIMQICVFCFLLDYLEMINIPFL